MNYLHRILRRHRDKRPKIPVRAVFLDFGGVIAEEGFRQGLEAIARRFHLPEEEFFLKAQNIMYACGYVVGKASEADYWRLVRNETGIEATDAELSKEILDRFVLRPGMMDLVATIRQNGLLAAILSDQTDWLDRLEARDGFFPAFDAVFNSFHLGRSKQTPAIFADVTDALGVDPGEGLFVDDNPENVQRAAAQGLQTHLFKSEAALRRELTRLVPKPWTPWETPGN